MGLRSYSEPYLYTTSPFSEALFYITMAHAQLERGILSERVKAGMERARRSGVRIDRPRATESPRTAPTWPILRRQVLAGEISRREAAHLLDCSESSIRRALAAAGE